MSVAAVVGAGALGGAVAHALAERAAFREIRLIDDQTNVAAGKALDIRQSGPIDVVDVDIVATGELLAAAGASVIILADPLSGPLEGEAGLAVVRQLVRAGTDAPLLFAGAAHAWLMEKAHVELKVPANRLVGSASAAQVGAARALIGLEMNVSGVDVQVTVVGRPPAFVLAWSSATVSGSLVRERIAPHRLSAVSRALAGLWPPGPQAIGVATAQLAAALVFGSRRLHQATTVLDGEPGTRGVSTMLPLSLGRGRVLERVMPSLSPQESMGTEPFSTDRR